MPPSLPFRDVLKKRAKLHPAERLLLGLVTGHICFLPWALGDMHVWSQLVSVLLAIAGFAVALWPRRYDATTSDAGSFRLIMWPKLFRFPIFWIGVLFLLYIAIQGVNPAWRYVEAGPSWWLVRVANIDWLPHGMETPFEKASPWRSLMIYGTAWLVVCSVWVGFTRRKSLRIFFSLLATNAFLLALLGFAERGLHADKIFWSWQPPAAYFVASFIYKNHAGAYFNLLLSLCVGLAVAYQERSRRRLDKSSPSGLFAFFAVTLALIVIFSYSRAATIFMFGYCVFALLAFLGRKMLAPPERGHGHLGVTALLCGLLGLSAISGLYLLPTGEAIHRMDQLVKSYESATASTRHLATLATMDLFHASPAYGWGAGSFRFAFPIYQRYYPKIYQQGNEHYYWEHAHNDYAELLAELGVVGTGLLLLGGAYYIFTFVRRRFWRDSLALLVSTGGVITLLHCLGDFNFFNPAILITWCVLWPAVTRWLELTSDLI